MAIVDRTRKALRVLGDMYRLWQAERGSPSQSEWNKNKWRKSESESERRSFLRCTYIKFSLSVLSLGLSMAWYIRAFGVTLQIARKVSRTQICEFYRESRVRPSFCSIHLASNIQDIERCGKISQISWTSPRSSRWVWYTISVVESEANSDEQILGWTDNPRRIRRILLLRISMESRNRASRSGPWVRGWKDFQGDKFLYDMKEYHTRYGFFILRDWNFKSKVKKYEKSWKKRKFIKFVA